MEQSACASASIRDTHNLQKTIKDFLRNRRWGGAAVAYMFYRCFFLFFFCVFFRPQKYETTVLGNVWTDFHETFTKRYREKCSLQRRAAAWRMANVDLRNLRYDSALAQSPEGATHGGYVIESWAREWI